MRGIKWTDKEVEIVANNYAAMGRKGVAKLLPHRSYSSISTKAKDLKIQPKRPIGKQVSIRQVKLKTKYGISIEEYDALFEEQQGRCAICGGVETTKHQCGAIVRLSVDHDHETGKIRGLLCRKCNTGLGCLGEDSTRLSSAINYLNRCNQ